MSAYTPRTGQRCACRPGQHRDNCPTCEGTGWVIDFRAIHEERARREAAERATAIPRLPGHYGKLPS